MAIYRLTYPADIYGSVEAGSKREAKEKFAMALDDLIDGICISIGRGIEGEIVYPKSNTEGRTFLSKISVEDIEE